MRVIMTNIEITDVGQAVDNLLGKVQDESDINITPSVLTTKELFPHNPNLPEAICLDN